MSRQKKLIAVPMSEKPHITNKAAFVRYEEVVAIDGESEGLPQPRNEVGFNSGSGGGVVYGRFQPFSKTQAEEMLTWDSPTAPLGAPPLRVYSWYCRDDFLQYLHEDR